MLLVPMNLIKLSGTFPVQNGLKERHAVSSLFYSFASEYADRKVKKKRLKLKELVGFWSTLMISYWRNINIAKKNMLIRRLVQK
jgi:hypothetical protein